MSLEVEVEVMEDVMYSGGYVQDKVIKYKDRAVRKISVIRISKSKRFLFYAYASTQKSFQEATSHKHKTIRTRDDNHSPGSIGSR